MLLHPTDPIRTAHSEAAGGDIAVGGGGADGEFGGAVVLEGVADAASMATQRQHMRSIAMDKK